MSEWQPIETAPKHTPILMLMKYGAIQGQWDGNVGSGYYWRDMEWYATHWMPLPPPPETRPIAAKETGTDDGNSNKSEA